MSDDSLLEDIMEETKMIESLCDDSPTEEKNSKIHSPLGKNS